MYSDTIVQKIGQISLQQDWDEVLRSGCNSIWVSCSIEGKKSIYGEISARRRPDGLELSGTDGFQVNAIGKYVLMVKNTDLNLTSYFFAPYGTFSKVHDKAVRCLDLSPAGALAVSCGDDEGLYVWQTDNGDIRRCLEGHINDVSQCCFFPSGTVVLSGGTDMRLKIWSVTDGSCPVTLVGHTGAITGTAIVERGRNIISCSRDGTAILWDCGTAQRISKLKSSSSVINCCCISQYGRQVGEGSANINNDKEVGTEGKLLLLGREDGYVDGIDVSSKKEVFSVQCHSAVNDCCFTGENDIAVGLQDGKVVYMDIRNTRTPRRICKYGKSSINCIQSFHGDSLLIGRGDGSCSCIRNNESPEIITMELCGPDCDPLFDVTSHENFVYTSCRDSKVRKYRMELND